MSSHACFQHVVSTRRAVLTLSKSRTSRCSKPPKRFLIPGSSARFFASKTTSSTFAESRRIPWVLSSIAAGAIGLYGAALLTQALKPCQNPAASDIAQQTDVSSRYDATADSFDSEVGFSELLMGINKMRKNLAKKCKGDVLEVSCGTGRNLGYYDISKESPVDSLTFVDLSPQMVNVCRRKWDTLYPTLLSKKDQKAGLTIRFLTASALDTMPPPPAKTKYDTIIQTMGLCSTPSPQELLLNMGRHLDTSNPDARIFLLEHGRSYRSWLNKILDNAAAEHAEIHGCWFNRDIGAIVAHAASQAGLEVVNERRRHLGTTWVYELAPDPKLVSKVVAKETVPEPPQSTSWWSRLRWT